MTGLLPVRMSMSSIASIDAIGARPLRKFNFVNAARYNKYIEFFISLSVYKLLRASRS